MTYVYTALRAEHREIRLLSLEPSKVGDEPLKLSLFTVPLDCPGSYEALSYAWGETLPKFDVKVNGFGFQIGGNLHSALRQLRYQDQRRRLWVDAICINQDDIQEREEQVSMMRGIYGTARSVIAWIGESDGSGDERAFDFMDKILNQIHSRVVLERFLAADTAPTSSEFSLAIHKDNMDWIRSVASLGLVGSPWLDLLHLLQRPWFSRIWIIQEVAMASEVTIRCGERTLDWLLFRLCIRFVKHHIVTIWDSSAPEDILKLDVEAYRHYQRSGGVISLDKAIKGITNVDQLRRQRRLIDLTTTLTQQRGQGSSVAAPVLLPPSIKQLLGIETPEQTMAQAMTHEERVYAAQPPMDFEVGKLLKDSSLYQLFRKFRSCDATDPRDKVYALLGIAEKIHDSHDKLPVSYEKSVEAVLWNLISNHLTSTKSLNFLSDASGLYGPKGFPSWIPLWYETHLETHPYSFLSDALASGYRAGGDTKAQFQFEEGTKLLKCQGIIVSTIEAVGEAYDSNYDNDNVDDPERLYERFIQTKWAKLLGVDDVFNDGNILWDAAQRGAISQEENRARFLELLSRDKHKMRRFLEFSITLMACGSTYGDLINATTVLDGNQTFVPSFAPHMVWPQSTNDKKYAGRVRNACHQRSIFTCKGEAMFGLGPANAEPGDVVTMFLGADLLYVLRQVGEHAGLPTFKLVGEAYCISHMNGEAINVLRASEDHNEFGTQTVQLV
uniref:Heterokaryon incompatibility domain-containing protein n=1 Tax=Bionectria ochroleuca TaxID=29856 RepID=A0A8H7K1W5_BIOOC